MPTFRPLNRSRAALTGSIVVLAMVAALPHDAAAAQAQSLIIVSPTTVQQGQAVTVTGVACASPATRTLLLDGSAMPFKAGTGADAPLEITTASLAAKSYKLVLKCGDAASQEGVLTVVPAVAVKAPRVVCAQNMSPRDDAPLEVQETSDEKAKRDELARQAKAKGEPPPPIKPQCVANVAWAARLEDTIAIQVAGYTDWVNQPGNKAKALTVFVDGTRLANLRLAHSETVAASGTDVFRTVLKFERDAAAADSRDTWAQLLRTARSRWWRNSDDQLSVSIGPVGEPQWETSATMRLNPFPTGLTWFAGVAVVALVVGIIAAAIKTPLLKDSNGADVPPYSLAKSQMAMWFVVVVGSYLFVTVSTGQSAATSPTALMLIGISGATGLVAVTMDANKRQKATNERRALMAEKAALTEALDGVSGGAGLRKQLVSAAAGSPEAVQTAAAVQAKVERLSAVTTALAQAAPEPAESKGWWRDLLSDQHGVSIHRLQMLAWTIVLVGTFVTAVFRVFAMPEFDATTLGLLGISSGTYLGFKFPEPTEKQTS